MQALLGLGVDRPRGLDRKACLHQRHAERVPRLGALVGEHDRHYAVVAQDPLGLREDRRHLRLVVGVRELLATLAHVREARQIGDRLVLLIGQLGGEQLRMDQPERALLPDVEEVRQLGIHDVVVVRRVDADKRDRPILDVG